MTTGGGDESDALELFGWAALAAGGALAQLASALAESALKDPRGRVPRANDFADIEAILTRLPQTIAAAEKVAIGERRLLLQRVRAALFRTSK